MKETARPTKLVDFKGLKEFHGVCYSRSHLFRLEQERRFPKRVTLGAHRVAWVETEIIEWAAALIAARDL